MDVFTGRAIERRDNEISALKAENERLRAEAITDDFIMALAKEVHNDHHGPGLWDTNQSGNPQYWRGRMERAIQRARSALSSPEVEGDHIRDVSKMVESEIWSDWLPWSGGECPIPWAKAGEWMRRDARGGPDEIEEFPATYYNPGVWLHTPPCGPFTAFRYRLDRAPADFKLPETGE